MKRLLAILAGVFVRNTCRAVFQHRIDKQLLFHIGIQFLCIELKDLDRLDEFRCHHQFLRLFNC